MGQTGKLAILLLGSLFFFARPGPAQTTEADKNFQSCLTEIGTCDQSMLTSAQRETVTKFQHQQNLWRCLTGSVICDHELLNPAEAKEIADSERGRNLLNCEQGFLFCD